MCWTKLHAVILDASLLLYAVDADSPYQHAGGDWLSAALNGTTRVGLPVPDSGRVPTDSDFASFPEVVWLNPLRS